MRSINFEQLVTLIGKGLQEEKIEFNGRLYELQYLVAQPGAIISYDIVEYQEGYIAKQPTGQIDAVEVLINVDWFSAGLKGGVSKKFKIEKGSSPNGNVLIYIKPN